MSKILLLALLFGLPLFAKEEKRQCKMGRDYFLYTPETVDKNKTYWLVVGVHGAKGNGKGAAGLSSWVEKYPNVIVVGPSFPISGPYYQGLGGESDQQLLNIHKELSKEIKLHPKVFLHGFSGGSQYSHRFANKHPKSVIGVSAHSGGSWEDAPDKDTAGIIWTLSCGLKDTALSTPESPLNRIDFFRKFYQAMNKGPFTAKPFVTQAGHSPAAEVKETAEECFRVATTGLFDYQRKAIEGMNIMNRESWIKKDIKLTEKEFNDGAKTYKLKVNPDGWTVGPAALKSMTDTRMMIDKLKK